MKAIVQIKGIFGSNFINKEIMIKINKGTILKELMEKLEKKVKIDFYTMEVNELQNPMILINGNKIELEIDFNKIINDNDLIMILQTIGGG